MFSGNLAGSLCIDINFSLKTVNYGLTWILKSMFNFVIQFMSLTVLISCNDIHTYSKVYC